MAIPASTAGDYFMIPEQIMAGKPKSGYTPAVGHLVVEDTTLANGYDRAASTENPIGIILSINGNPSNGTISVARLQIGTSTIILEYTDGSAPALGARMVATGASGTVTVTDRDSIVAGAAGNLIVRAVLDSTAKTCVVERIAITATP